MNDFLDLPAIIVTKKTGREKFHLNKNPLPLNLLSFWQWSSSDLVGNILRGVLAEYIVLSAVGGKQDTRTEWDAYDVLTSAGIKVEVKTSAYIQSWVQKNYSHIEFNIKPTKILNAETNTYSARRVRQSDVYVFCVLAHKNKDTIDPLNLAQWEFFVIATDTLNKSVGAKENIRLSSLIKLKPFEVTFEEIDNAIKQVLNIIN